jgi:serine/threonine-protein kinase
VRFGPYLLLERLGEGGNGTVHLAKPIDPHRGVPTPLVIKRLNHRPTEDSQRRFQHEAAIAVSVESPHVVKVFDVGAVDQQPYIAMELVRGFPLARVFRALVDARRYAAIPAAVELILGGLRGLAALHEATDPRTGEPLGAVHRDLSPRNVMVDDRGRLRLIDLGLGKSNIQDWRTRTGMVMGSPGYMAPEQACGEPVDHRADLYSLAAILYETLVLEPYIPRGDPAEMLRAMAAPRYAPMTEKRANLPPALEEAVQRGLSLDPEDRWPTAEAFIAALERAVPQRDPEAFGKIMRELLGSELLKLEERIASLVDEETALEEDASETVIYAVRSGVQTIETASHTAPMKTRPMKRRERRPLAAIALMMVLGVLIGLLVHHYALEPEVSLPRTVPLPRPAVSVRQAPTAVEIETDTPVAPAPPPRTVRRAPKKAPVPDPPPEVETRTVETSLARMLELARAKRAQHPARTQEIDSIVTDASIWAHSNDRETALMKIEALERSLIAIQ